MGYSLLSLYSAVIKQVLQYLIVEINWYQITVSPTNDKGRSNREPYKGIKEPISIKVQAMKMGGKYLTFRNFLKSVEHEKLK